MKSLTEAGQIRDGAIVALTKNNVSKAYVVVKVIFPGEGNEEILLRKKKNIYFITSMAIDGSSWAKDVKYHNPT